MQNIVRRMILAGAVTIMLAGGAAFAQTSGLAGSDGIVILTNQNEADVVNEANNTPILAAIGSPSFFRVHRAELTAVASAHKRKLLVVYADPNTIDDANQIVAQLTNGDINYPMILFLGNETRKLRGTLAPGAITTLVDAELRK